MCNRFPTLPRDANDDVRAQLAALKALHAKTRRGRDPVREEELRKEAHALVAAYILREHSRTEYYSERFPRVMRTHPHFDKINDLVGTFRSKRKLRYTAAARERARQACLSLRSQAMDLVLDL